MTTANTMTIELVKILEAAQKYDALSMRWFEIYTDSKDELDWNTCKEYDMRTEGLLEAYEILTGKRIRPFQIEDELALA